MTLLAQRLVGALRTWPDIGLWRRTFYEAFWSAPLILLIAWMGGLASYAPTDDWRGALPIAATLFVFPALGEEILFRALLIPRAPKRPQLWIAISTIVFILWHPLQVVTFGPSWSALFLDPWFLACAAIMGLALGRIYVATQSVWPCVLFHWAVVASWKLLFGGPFG